MSSTSVCTSARERSIRWALSLVILLLTAGGLAYCERHFTGHPRSWTRRSSWPRPASSIRRLACCAPMLATNPDHGAANLLLAQILLKAHRNVRRNATLVRLR